MKKEQADLENAVVWIPDSKMPNRIGEVPLTDLALEAVREQIRISGPGIWLFPGDENPTGHQKTLKTVGVLSPFCHTVGQFLLDSGRPNGNGN